ncbi:MAG: hypothetical protein ACYTE5_07545 [Planctomycetota bacterium]
MNLVNEQMSKPLFLGIYPKCPFYQPVPVLIILALIGFGTWGIYYLNLWAAVGYIIFSLIWYFLVMPFTLCKYCYYKAIETTVNKENGKTIKRLLPLEKWREMKGIEKHVGQSPWTVFMSVIWLLPIVLIVISFFSKFSAFAIIALIGFLGVLVGNYYYMLLKKCPTCAIKEDCHAAFGRKR